jgi:molybdopterin-guanine dinucleotide biosynthesis protein A
LKIIVIAGAASGVGKTFLGRNIAASLGVNNCELIKFGHGATDSKRSERLFTDIQVGLEYVQTVKVSYLIIESNAVVEFIKPDLLIYLAGATEQTKPSAELARSSADIIIDQKFDPINAEQACQQKLGNNLIFDALLTQYRWGYCGAIILAGGNSRRMGTNKALMDSAIKSRNDRAAEDLSCRGLTAASTIISGLITTLKTYFSTVYISAKQQSDYKFEIPVIADLAPDCGPLMGIYSSLRQSAKEKNFIIATDIPVIDLQCIQKLLFHASQYDIVVPANNGQLEPLYAIYSKCLSVKIKNLLEQGERKVAVLFDQCETKVIEIEMPWYKNLNTREDYECYLNSSR